jgi:hypothetical protein
VGGGVIAGDAGQEVQEEEMKVGGEVEEGWRDAEEREEGVVEVEEATLVVCPMSVITSWESQVNIRGKKAKQQRKKIRRKKAKANEGKQIHRCL